MKKCMKCDLSYHEDKKFCKKCGAPLEAEMKIEAKAEAKKQVFEEKLKAEPLNVKLLHEYAQFLFETKLFKEAVSVALKIIAIDEKDNGAKALLFNAFLQIGDYPNAVETGEELYPSKNTDTAFLLLFANAYQQAGNSQRAVEIYDQILKLEPENTESAYHKALALLSQNKPEEAAPIFGQRYAGGKTDRITAIYAGIEKTMNNDFEAAIDILTPVLSEKDIQLSDPDNNRGFFYLAYALCHTTDDVKKIDHWAEMFDLYVLENMHHQMDEVYLAKTITAIFELKLKKLDKKAERYEIKQKIAEYIDKRDVYFTEHSNPVFATAWHAAALKQEGFGFYDDAIASMKRCVKLAPGKQEYSNKLDELTKTLAAINSKKKKRKVITWSVIIVALATAISAYYLNQRYQENKAWDAALEENTPGTFQSFARAYPEGRFTEEALTREEDLVWDVAKEENTFYSYDRYMKRYSNGRYISEARKQQEELVWSKAAVEDTWDSYLEYIETLPNGKRVQMARDKIKLVDQRDGKTYKVVKIGDQWWMAENLNYATASGSWCYGNRSSYCDIYGRLYNYNAAINACPPGWHLPNDSEWNTLVNYLGGQKVAGGKMKSVGTTHWSSPNTGATNESGFSALPGGCGGGSFDCTCRLSYGAIWWSITETSQKDAWRWNRGLTYRSREVYRGFNYPGNGFSVRCLKD